MVDISNPQMYQQMEAVYETLDRLDIRDKTIITVFNKQDKVEKLQIIKDAKADRTVRISAKKEEGFEELLQTIEEILQSRKQLIEKVYPYDQGSTLQIIRKYGQILEEEYLPEGTKIKAYIPKEWVNRV